MLGKLSVSIDQLNLDRFFKQHASVDGPVSLVRQRIYILPTRNGVLFASILLVMLIGSINYNNSLGYLLTFLLAAVNIISIVHTYKNLLNLTISVGSIAAVFCGEKIKVPIVIDNTGDTERYAIELNFPSEKQRSSDVPENNWITLNLAHTALQRGLHRLPRLTISSTFPMGLFRAWSTIQLNNTYLVYPEPVGTKKLPMQWLELQQSLRGYHKGSEDFSGLTTYNPGDSLRHIHWKAYAREQGLQTKKFAGNNDQELWLDWRTMSNNTTEAKLSQLSKWVEEADKTEMNYGLWLPGKRIAPSLGPMHKKRCLEALALHRDKP